MESPSILPAGLKSGPVRDHVSASGLALALFLLLFSKALMGGSDFPGACPSSNTWV